MSQKIELMEARVQEVRAEEERILGEQTKVRRELQAIDLYLKVLHGELPEKAAHEGMKGVGDGRQPRAAWGERQAANCFRAFPVSARIKLE